MNTDRRINVITSHLVSAPISIFHSFSLSSLLISFTTWIQAAGISPSPLYMGLDLSTQGLKILLTDEKGCIVHETGSININGICYFKFSRTVL